MRQIPPYRTLLLVPAMLICMAGLVYSQTLPPATDTLPSAYRFGIFAGLGIAAENVNLEIPGYGPDCGSLQQATGGGWNTGLVIDILDLPFLPRWGLGLRLGIERKTGEMRHQGDPFPLRSETGDIVSGRVDQVIAHTATGIDFSLTGSRRLIADLYGDIGLGAWFRLFSEQKHREVAVDPAELLLVNNKREMELTTGSLFPYNSIVPIALLGLHYDLPIGRESYLSPEVRLSYSLLNWTTDGSWRSLQFTGGVSVRFGFPGDRKADDVVPPPDSIPPRPPVLVADIATAPEIVTVEITEYDSTDWVPVLNAVFFDEESAVIPERYRTLSIAETSEFSTVALTGSVIEVYYNALNIIGLRMQGYPDATLKITGYRNGRESTQELSLRRAQAVRDYLVNTWDIFPKRITVEGGGLPPKPVPERTQEGLEENAMARITSSDLNITVPLRRTYILRIATPPSVTFYPRAISEAGLVAWELDVEGEGTEWKHFEGKSLLPDSIRWDWTSDSGSLPTLPIKLGYRLTLHDSAGQITQTRTLPINVTLKEIKPDEPDTLIESYSLLLFDYDSPDVSSADRELLRAIAGRVKPGASVRFTGYTDSLGDEARNKGLALRRAEAAARMFREFAPKNISIIINDQGGENERFPFSTPEGRSYDRTVVIEVRTPTLKTE